MNTGEINCEKIRKTVNKTKKTKQVPIHNKIIIGLFCFNYFDNCGCFGNEHQDTELHNSVTRCRPRNNVQKMQFHLCQPTTTTTNNTNPITTKSVCKCKACIQL